MNNQLTLAQARSCRRCSPPKECVGRYRLEFLIRPRGGWEIGSAVCDRHGPRVSRLSLFPLVQGVGDCGARCSWQGDVVSFVCLRTWLAGERLYVVGVSGAGGGNPWWSWSATCCCRLRATRMWVRCRCVTASRPVASGQAHGVGRVALDPRRSGHRAFRRATYGPLSCQRSRCSRWPRCCLQVCGRGWRVSACMWSASGARAATRGRT